MIDNLRFDQWKIIQPLVQDYFKVETEESFFSILPTATQYARNAIFSGFMPSEMEKRYPNFWKNDTDEGGMNLFENDFLTAQIKRLNLDIKHEYYKITNLKKDSYEFEAVIGHSNFVQKGEIIKKAN